jgi:hypothetical protein
VLCNRYVMLVQHGTVFVVVYLFPSSRWSFKYFYIGSVFRV